MSIPSQLYFPGIVSPISKLVVLNVKVADVATLLDDSLETAELLLDDEDETARLDDELDELGICAAALELLPGDEPPQAVNNKNEK
jgi:hypothetical protein